MEKGVDHDVADEADTCGVDSLAYQVGLGVAFRGVEQVCHLISQDAIDFFRHLAVVTAKTCLDMNYGNPLLDPDQGAGQGRVHISDNQHAGRPMLIDDRFEAPHDFSRLNRM